MSEPGRTPLPEYDRRRVFKALVDAQDRKVPVDRSRALIAARFGIHESQIPAIELEGIDGNWPPLDRRPRRSAG
jgi:hypothetical protein